jgi:hypothetical protein
LGIYISDNLGWKKNTEEIAKKANRCLGILRPLKFILDRASLETLYKSFIRPLLEYADIVWDAPDAHRHNLDILEKVQMEAARLVTGATARCSTERLYNEVGWETRALRRRLHRSTMMFKIMTGLAPESLQQKIPNRVEARTRYRLRNRGNLQVPLTRLVTYCQSFFPNAVRLWNDFSEAITGSTSIASFKHNYLKATPRPTTNPLFYRGDRRLAVSHSCMRIGCSSLNADLCRELHVVESPACTCPSGDEETADHFLLHCQNYADERRPLLQGLTLLEHPNPSAKLLLYGDRTKPIAHNAEIFQIVRQFLFDTKRFTN